MRKQIFIIICCLIFSGFCRADEDKSSDDVAMEKLIDNISELAAKVLEMFEPIVTNKNETADKIPDNTYFVSFLLRGGNSKTMKATDITPKKRMVVNNNFSSDKMGTSQVYMESGPSAKQPPSHNIQLLSNPSMQSPNHPPQSQGPQAYHPYV